MLSSSLASGRSYLKVLGVEEEPHLVTVLMEKMSAVEELQTLSEDMSGWLSGSKQGIAALVCVLVMCLYYWSIGAANTQFTGKQAYYERIGEICIDVRTSYCIAWLCHLCAGATGPAIATPVFLKKKGISLS